MIEKVTLQLTGDSKLVPENGPDCGEMNPKTLLLYAAAKCSGMTALMIMEKERLRPKRFEISVSGELSTEEVRSESVFKSFHVVYNIECEKYCGIMRMFRMIAPVSHEIAVVSTEPAKA